MREIGIGIVSLSLLVAACAGSHGPTRSTLPTAPELGNDRCPETIHVDSLLRSHAETFGSERDLDALLPLELEGLIEDTNGAPKSPGLVMSPTSCATTLLPNERHRRIVFQNGKDGMRSPIGSGINEQGSWAIIGGTRARLTTEESVAQVFDAWFARRRYLSAFVPDRDRATCAVVDGKRRISVTYEMPAIGSPMLVFDERSAEIREAHFTTALGSRARRKLGPWVRFGIVLNAADGSQRMFEMTSGYAAYPGAQKTKGIWLPSEQLEDGRVCHVTAVRSRCGDCTQWADLQSAQYTRLTRARPAAVEAPVKFRMVFGHVLADVAIAGERASAVIDTGAPRVILDSRTRFAFEARGRIGLTSLHGDDDATHAEEGELRNLSMGAVELSHVPTIRAPLPVLAAYGASRPDVILGLPLFMHEPVRIDYTRSEIVFGERALDHVSKTAVSLHVRGERLVVDVGVGTEQGPFLLDTGSANAFDLNDRWVATHGLSFGKTTQITRQLGIGASPSTVSLFRLPTASVGPLRVTDALAGATAFSNEVAGLAGILGNPALARCQGIVIDVPRRLLWLEGPCDRPVRERKTGFAFAWSDKDQSWLVTGVIPGGAAERAGLRAGDRLASIDGMRMTFENLDLDLVDQKLSQPEGAHVKISVQRGAAESVHDLTLARLP